MCVCMLYVYIIYICTYIYYNIQYIHRIKCMFVYVYYIYIFFPEPFESNFIW